MIDLSNLTDDQRAALAAANLPAGELVGSAKEQAKTGFGYRGVLIGTSLVEHQYTASMNEIRTNSRSWLTWLEILSFGAMRFRNWMDPTIYPGWEPNGVSGSTRGQFGANCGVGGQTTQQILARMPLILSLQADFYLIDAGTNDVTAGVDKDTIVARKCQIVDQCADAGKTTFVLPIRARGTASWASGSNERKIAHYCNQKLRDYVASKSRCFMVDWNVPLVDGRTQDGTPYAGYLDDAIHDAPLGGFAIANWMWNGDGISWPGFKSFFPPQPTFTVSADDVYDATYNPRGNLQPNGMFRGTGGMAGTGTTTSSGIASSMRVERQNGNTTCVATLEPAPQNQGYSQVITFTPAGGADDLFYLRYNNSNGIDVSGLANQWIEGSIDVEVSAYDGWTRIENYLISSADNVATRGNFPHPPSGTRLPQPTVAWRGRIFTPPLKLGAAPTFITNRLQIGVNGAVPGSPVVKASQFAIRPIADPRALYGLG